MRICTKCKTPKPATSEYFHYHDAHRGGLRHDCKECRNKYQKAYMKNGGTKRLHEETPHRTAFKNTRSRVKRTGKYKWLLGEARSPEAEAYIEYLQTITHCPDCSKEMVWFSYSYRNNPDSASFDRIDSNEDYTKKNVRVVCRHCNQQKNDSPVDEWVGLLKVRVEKGIIEEVDPKLTEFLSEEQTLKKG